MSDAKTYVSGHPTAPTDTIESLRARLGVMERQLAEVTKERDSFLQPAQELNSPKECEDVAATGGFDDEDE